MHSNNDHIYHSYNNATARRTFKIEGLLLLTFKGPMTTLVVTEGNRQWPNDD
jgi:hypothetical protein